MRKPIFLLLSAIFLLPLLTKVSLSTDWFYYGQFSEHFDDGQPHFGGFGGSFIYSNNPYYAGGVYFHAGANVQLTWGPDVSSIGDQVEYILVVGTGGGLERITPTCQNGYTYRVSMGTNPVARNICPDSLHKVGFSGYNVFLYGLHYLNDYGEPISGIWYPFPMTKVIYSHVNFDDSNIGLGSKSHTCADLQTLKDDLGDTNKLYVYSFDGGPCWFSGTPPISSTDFYNESYWYQSIEFHVVDTSYVDKIRYQIPSAINDSYYLVLTIDSSGLSFVVTDVSGTTYANTSTTSVKLQNNYEYLVRVWRKPTESDKIVINVFYAPMGDAHMYAYIDHITVPSEISGYLGDFSHMFEHVHEGSFLVHFSQSSVTDKHVVGVDRMSVTAFHPLSYFEVQPMFQGFDFGNVQTGDTNVEPAYYIDLNGNTYSYGYDSLRIRVSSNRNYKVEISGTNYNGGNYGDTIPISNLKAAARTYPTSPSSSEYVSLSTTYTSLGTFDSTDNTVYLFFLLDVPTGIHVDRYTNTINIKVTQV